MTEALIPYPESNILCNICPDPGHCCSGFTLFSNGVERTIWKDELAEFTSKVAPFVPLRTKEYYSKDEATLTDRAFLRVLWTCPKLQPGGRCGIYADRPKTCRTFLRFPSGQSGGEKATPRRHALVSPCK